MCHAVLVPYILRLSLPYGFFVNVSDPSNLDSLCTYMGCLASMRSCIKAGCMSKWRSSYNLAVYFSTSNGIYSLCVVIAAVYRTVVYV